MFLLRALAATEQDFWEVECIKLVRLNLAASVCLCASGALVAWPDSTGKVVRVMCLGRLFDLVWCEIVVVAVGFKRFRRLLARCGSIWALLGLRHQWCWHEDNLTNQQIFSFFPWRDVRNRQTSNPPNSFLSWRDARDRNTTLHQQENQREATPDPISATHISQESLSSSRKRR